MTSRQEAEEFTQTVGQGLQSNWRMVAWGQRNGIPEALDKSPRDWVLEDVGGYVRLASDERIIAIRELREDGFTYLQIANALGVGNNVIANAIRPESDQVELPVNPPESRDVDPEPEPDQVELPVNPPESRDVDPEPINPYQERDRYEREAFDQALESFGKAIHTLANYKDAHDARMNLVSRYGPPGLPVTSEDMTDALKALERFHYEWVN